MNKKQGIAVCIYVVGIICVVYFLMRALIGGSQVSNPDVMIPYTEFERNSIILALGCIPMTISCIFFSGVFCIKKRIRRIMVFVPAIITAIPFVTIIGIVVLMLIRGCFEIVFG